LFSTWEEEKKQNALNICVPMLKEIIGNDDVPV
jgi:hypothetical protein